MGSGKIILGLLIGITVYGSILRVYKLATAPPSVNWDEASYGYNAYSLWKTGRDEYGTPLPLAFRSFDDFKPPVYAYASAPIVGLFGLNEFNTRLVSAMAGILTILVTFILASKIFKNLGIGLIAAGLVASSPWSVHYSRLAFEAVPALLLLAISWIYLLAAEKNQHKYIPAMFFMTLSYFAYNSHKLYWLFTIVWIGWKLRNRITKEISLSVKLGVICLPVVYTILSGQSLARFSSTSILPLYKETRSVYLFAGEFINRYISYFSPVNVFVRGTNEPNQKVFDLAVFYPFMGLFYLIGLGWLIKNWRSNSFLLFWTLAGPIPAAITWSWFTPIRVLPLWLMMTMLIAQGVWRIRKKRWLLTMVIVWWGLSSWWYLISEVWYMPYVDYGQWQWGFRETIAEIKPLLKNYDYVVWETPQAQPHIFTLFYSKFDPALYQAYVMKNPIPIPRKIFDVPGITFRKIYWPSDKLLKKVIFVGSIYSLPESDIKRDGVKMIKDIIDPAGYVVYRIVTY